MLGWEGMAGISQPGILILTVMKKGLSSPPLMPLLQAYPNPNPLEKLIP